MKMVHLSRVTLHSPSVSDEGRQIIYLHVICIDNSPRICPGRHVGNASMWIAIASMLATFDLLKAQDDSGNEIDFSPQFTTGATSCVPVFFLLHAPRL